MADPGFDARLNVVGHRERRSRPPPARAPRGSSSPPPGAPYMERARAQRRAALRRGRPLRAVLGLRAEQAGGRGLRRPLRAARAGSPAGPCASGTSTARGRTRRPRPAWSRSSASLARDGGRPTVFGTGEQTRDYIHVADVVAALLAMRRRARRRGPINVGTGVETSVLRAGRADRRGSPGARTSSPSFAPARDRARSSAPCSTRSSAAERLGWRGGAHDRIRPRRRRSQPMPDHL